MEAGTLSSSSTGENNIKKALCLVRSHNSKQNQENSRLGSMNNHSHFSQEQQKFPVKLSLSCFSFLDHKKHLNLAKHNGTCKALKSELISIDIDFGGRDTLQTCNRSYDV